MRVPSERVGQNVRNPSRSPGLFLSSIGEGEGGGGFSRVPLRPHPPSPRVGPPSHQPVPYQGEGGGRCTTFEESS
eukprot:scaffold412_cov311-Pavlova_lutheri.AAC.33